MTLNEYQQHALETAIYPENRRIIYPTLGLTGEAGEVADKVKKVARELGYELDDVAQMNVDKLRSRMQRHIISGSGDNR